MIIKNKDLNSIVTMKKKEFLFWIIFAYILGAFVVLIGEHNF